MIMSNPMEQRKTDSERVKVVVRVRPLNEKECESHEETVVEVDTERNEISVKKLPSNNSSFGMSSSETELKPFTFDGVFDNSFHQKQIYDQVFHGLVDSVLHGFNGTIFAYGQTGTGKTFTMEGSWESEEMHGVMPNSFKHIFDHISENPSQRYLIRASYLEIYQEDVRDLLSNGKLKKCDIREGPNGVYIRGLSTYLCSNFKEIAELMTKGNKNRSVGSTNMNEHSSRSHAIFQITVETSEQWDEDGEHIKVGKLNLVDLAGSEKVSKTGAEGERFKEATKINLSLSSLGNVISALVDGAAYIPYRDSKLTRLLQDSLGGNSRTVMVATVGPAAFNYDETMNTLRYASRTKNIKNKPRINENPKDAVLRHYQEEINRLRSLVDEKKSQRRSPIAESEVRDGSDRQNKEARLEQELPQGQNPMDLMKESRVKQLTELLDPYGIKFEGDLCEIMNQLQDRKVSLMKNTQMVKEDKEKLLAKLQHATEEIRSAETECSQLVTQIEWLESKVLNSSGKQSLIQKMEHQKKEIKMKEKELEDQKARHEELRKVLVEKQMTFEETLSTLNSTEDEFSAKIEKISKIQRKTIALEDEINEIKSQHGDNIRKVETCVEEISRELKLKKLIVDNFIPRKVLKDVDKRIRYDDAEDTYFIEPRVLTPMEPIPVDRMVLFPMFNKTRFTKLAPTKNMFYSNENLLLLEPEYPKWKAKHYVDDKINPKMETLFKDAMKDMQKTLVVNCDHRTSSSKIWKSEAPEYTAVGPNILLRKIRSEKFIDYSYVPSDINLPRGSNISTIQIPSRTNNICKFTHEELLAFPLMSVSGEIFFEDKSPSPQIPNSIRQSRGNRDREISHPIPSRPTTAYHSQPMGQHEEEWIPKTGIDYEIEQMERELMEGELQYDLSTSLGNKPISVEFTRPRTSRPESRKGKVSNPRTNREESEHSQIKLGKKSQENEIIRRLERVGLHSPNEEDEGTRSLGDYLNSNAVDSSHLKLVIGSSKSNVSLPYKRFNEQTLGSSGSSHRPQIPQQQEKSTDIKMRLAARHKEMQAHRHNGIEPEGSSRKSLQAKVSPNNAFIPDERPSTVNPFYSKETSDRPKTARKIPPTVYEQPPPKQSAKLSHVSDKSIPLQPLDIHDEAVMNEDYPETEVRPTVRFPYFQTANDIGLTAGNRTREDDDDTLTMTEGYLSESDLESSSEEDNSIVNENNPLPDSESGVEDELGQNWTNRSANFSERPPTRPSSQRRANHSDDEM